MDNFPPDVRVLVHHIGSLGDTLVTIPALEALRRHFGRQSSIHLLHSFTPGRVGTQSVLESTGLLDAYVPYSSEGSLLQRIGNLLPLWRKLIRGRYDVAVSVVHTRRSALSFAREKLFFWLCGIRRTIGFFAYPEHTLSPRDQNGWPGHVDNEVLLRLERLYAGGITRLPGSAKPILPIPAETLSSVGAWLKSQRKFPERPLVILSPGGNMKSNLWPLDRFAEIGAYLMDRKGCEIVVVGGSQEKEAAARLLASWGRGIDATGRFSVLESAALMRHSAFVVTVNSGPMHLASAVEVACVVLMGGRDFPGSWDPIGDEHIILRHPVLCGGCQCKECPVEGHPCMTGIPVEEARKAIDRICGDSLGMPGSATPVHLPRHP